MLQPHTELFTFRVWAAHAHTLTCPTSLVAKAQQAPGRLGWSRRGLRPHVRSGAFIALV